MKSLELFKVSPMIVNFLKSNMLNWNTALFLSHKNENLKVELSPSKKICAIWFIESTLKLTKNGFYFILKFLFVPKILKVLSRLFGHVEKTS